MIIRIHAALDSIRGSNVCLRTSFQSGLREERRDDVRQVDRAGDQEDLLDRLVVALHDDPPDDERADRDGYPARDPEDLERGRPAGELGDRVPDVRHEERDEEVERRPQAVVLADELAEALAGDRAEARGHLLDDDEGHRDRDERPEQRVAEVGARDRVRRDAAGVVVDVRRDDPGPEDREKDRGPPLPGPDHGARGAVSAAGAITAASAGGGEAAGEGGRRRRRS